MLRQTTNVNANRLHRVHAPNTIFGENVDHSRRESGIGHHRDALSLRLLIECLLLTDNLRIAAEIGEMYSGIDREPRHVEVEVVRNRTHHRVALPHQPAHGVLIAHVEGSRQ